MAPTPTDPHPPRPTLGIGTGNADIEQCLKMAMRPGVKKNWLQCRHLIVDEISMIDGDFLDKMEVVARLVWGGGAGLKGGYRWWPGQRG